MKKQKNSFAWFDHIRLLQEPTYPDYLASQLQYTDSVKLAQILKDCTSILLTERAGKSYQNSRKKHISQNELLDISKLSTKIKGLCKTYPITWCVDCIGFNVPSGQFPFEIDLLDLIAFHVLNFLDASFSSVQKDLCNSDTQSNLMQTIYCWYQMQEKIMQWNDSQKVVGTLIYLAESMNKLKQIEAGSYTAAENRMKAMNDDLQIAFVLLYLINDESNKNMMWNSVHHFSESLINGVNEGVKYLPLKAQATGLYSVSIGRLTEVIKEMNNFDNSLLSGRIKKPIPDIKSENSRWLHYKIIKKWHADFEFHYLSRVE